MERELICIMCPNGCHLKVDDALNVTGAKCPRGVAYGKAEVSHPTRVLTTTVKIKGGDILKVCPVKSKEPIPKEKLFEAMEEVNKLCVSLPIKMNQVIVEDLLGTGIPLIATREIKE